MQAFLYQRSIDKLDYRLVKNSFRPTSVTLNELYKIIVDCLLLHLFITKTHREVCLIIFFTGLRSFVMFMVYRCAPYHMRYDTNVDTSTNSMMFPKSEVDISMIFVLQRQKYYF